MWKYLSLITASLAPVYLYPLLSYCDEAAATAIICPLRISSVSYGFT